MCLTLTLLLASATDAAANIHGVRRLQIVPNDAPPVYDFEQVQDAVRGAIERSERNLKIQVAILKIDPLRPTNGCGSNSAAGLFAGFQLYCESLSSIGNAIDGAIRRDQIQTTVDQLRQAHVESDAALGDSLAGEVEKLLASNLLQLQLAVNTANYIAERTRVDLVGDIAGADAEHALTVKLERVEAVGSPVDAQVAIRLHGSAALIRRADGTTIDSYSYATETSEYFVEGWSEGGIGLLAGSVAAAAEQLAEVLADEVLLAVNSPRLRRKGYLLEPEAPLNKRCFGSKCGVTAIRGYAFYPTETLQPEFRWQDFRGAYAKDPLYEDTDSADLDIVYDLRIYGTRRVDSEVTFPGVTEAVDASFIFGAELLHEFRNIAATSFVPSVALEPCKSYMWTVRAQFTVDGRRHVTHWSGNYDEKDVEDYRGKLVSNSAGARGFRAAAGSMGFDQRATYREQSYYFPFRVTEPGQECADGE